ncbi:Excinuclease ABC, C subunit-like [hydrothermal vent metagenome]|uniref:Excinuclease ABC, C subunit-like n=1 Tax=hydrothermal vent metagenome TaxID=652676 RepID=A0A3B0V3V4_9ZZZZ
MKQYFVYIMSSTSGTLYIGVTNDLARRVYQHKEKQIDGFTKRYDITRLVYFEQFSNVRDAIAREKSVKKWRRSKKIALIKTMNLTWKDLSDDWD